MDKFSILVKQFDREVCQMAKHITPKQLMELQLKFPEIRIIHLVGGYYLVSKYAVSNDRKLDFVKRNQYILAKVD